MKIFAAKPASAEFNAATIRYMQLANMTQQQYADTLAARLCEAEHAYDEGLWKDVLIEKMVLSIRYRLRPYYSH